MADSEEHDRRLQREVQVIAEELARSGMRQQSAIVRWSPSPLNSALSDFGTLEALQMASGAPLLSLSLHC
jgi:hypothetical protein